MLDTSGNGDGIEDGASVDMDVRSEISEATTVGNHGCHISFVFYVVRVVVLYFPK